MALPHAHPLDVLDIRPLGARLSTAVSTSLLKTDSLQLMRLVLQAGNGLPRHEVPGAVTIQCIEGEVVVSTGSRQCDLRAGELVMLGSGEPHALKAVVDSSLLVTIILVAGG